jgi:uncharacterized protein (TIGR02246 family)
MEKTNTNESESAAVEIIDRMAEAWEQGDGEAFGALFSNDAQYVTAPGERLHGRERIAQSHQHMFHTFFKGTRLGRDYPLRFRSLDPKVVLVELSGSVLFPGEKETGVPPNGLMTLVIKKEVGGWRIVSFQNTLTGRLRNIRFMWRFVVSRLSPFRQEWSKARRYMLEEKRRNMVKCNRKEETPIDRR